MRRDPPHWRRFFLAAAGGAAALVALTWLFVVMIDPWGVLPLAPALPRVPVTTASRYAYPMIARSPDFDSVIIGTSTSRPLRPTALDALFGARFANLSINAATAHEQSRMLGAFLQAHPHPRAVLVGLDMRWCDTAATQRQDEYPFPEWMYDARRWRGYLTMLNAYAVQEAVSEAAVMLRLKRSRIAPDGYLPFPGPNVVYDPVRAHQHIVEIGDAALPVPPGAAPAEYPFPQLARLGRMLDAIPSGTRTVLFFTPFVISAQGRSGEPSGAVWAECKRRVARIAAAHPGTAVADFNIPSPITREETNYWDAVHYRDVIADRLARDLVLASAGLPAPDGDDRILAGAASGSAMAPGRTMAAGMPD